MPLRFNERDTAAGGNIVLAALLAVSLACVGVYSAEGDGGPLHSLQGAVGAVASPLHGAGARIQSAQEAAQTALGDLNADASTLSELREQNEQLRQMVSQLEEYRQTALRLEGIQRLRDAYAIEGATCHVTNVSRDSWNRVVTIDKGSDDGVAPGLPVMGSTGLVGQVKSVSGDSAEVRLLQDPNSGVAVILQSNRAEGLLKGDIDGLLYLEDVDNDVEVKVGENVITSGLGGGYFRGLMVGTVVRVEATNGQSIRQIVVAPNDSASALEEVMVVTGISSEGALSENAEQAAAPSAEGSRSASASEGDGAAADGGEPGDSPLPEDGADAQADASEESL